MLDLDHLNAEAVRAVTLARKTYDQAMTAFRAAPKGSDEAGRSQEVLYAASDTINVAQGVLYMAAQAKALQDTSGVSPSDRQTHEGADAKENNSD